MKRPLRPVTDYREHEAYPSVEEEHLSRREFLRRAVATSATAAAGAVALSTTAHATPKDADKRERVVVYLDRWHRIGKSSMRAEKLVVFTKDKKLARFLRNYSKSRKLRQAVKARVRKMKESAIYNGKKLYKLERELGGIVAREYHKKTKKRTPHPDVMLTVTPYYYRHMGGVIAPPSRPFRPHP